MVEYWVLIYPDGHVWELQLAGDSKDLLLAFDDKGFDRRAAHSPQDPLVTIDKWRGPEKAFRACGYGTSVTRLLLLVLRTLARKHGKFFWLI